MLQRTFFLLISLLLISCTTKEIEVSKEISSSSKEPMSYSAFTIKMVSKYNLDAAKIKQLQFYTSHEITLERLENETEAEIKEGKLLVATSTHSKILLIKALTPARVIEVDNEKIVVCFDKDVILTFLNPYYNCPQKSGKFYLAAESWSDGVGSLMLEDKEYSAKGVSGRAFLMIDKKEIQKESETLRLVKGERVSLKK